MAPSTRSTTRHLIDRARPGHPDPGPVPGSGVVTSVHRGRRYDRSGPPARRRHGRRRPARPDDAPGRDRARPVAAGARRPRPTTPAALVAPDVVLGEPRPTSTRCARSPTARDVVTFDHEHVPQRAPAGAGRRGRRPCTPAPDALRARAGQARRCASGWPSSARRCRAFAEVADAADVERFGRAHRLAGGAQGGARRLRRPGRVAARRPDAASSSPSCSPPARR